MPTMVRLLGIMDRAQFYDAYSGTKLNDYGSGLIWRTQPRDDRPDDPIRFYALCNTFFYWATADMEEITPNDLDLLEECLHDLRKACPDDGGVWLTELYVCRKRKLRPLQGWFSPMTDAIRALFLASGPERTQTSEEE